MRVGIDPQADAADAERLELGEGGRILWADKDVDRLGSHSPHHGADGPDVRQIRSVEDISPCLRKSGKSTDGVIKVRDVPQEVVRATGQNDPSVRSGSR